MPFLQACNANFTPVLVLTERSSRWEKKGTHSALLLNWHWKWHCLIVNYALIVPTYLHQGQGQGQVSGEGCRLPLGTRYIIRRKPLTRYKIREKPSTRYMKVHNACKGYRQCIYLCKAIDTNTTVTKTTLHHWGDHHDQNQQRRFRDPSEDARTRLT